MHHNILNIPEPHLASCIPQPTIVRAKPVSTALCVHTAADMPDAARILAVPDLAFAVAAGAAFQLLALCMSGDSLVNAATAILQWRYNSVQSSSTAESTAQRVYLIDTLSCSSSSSSFSSTRFLTPPLRFADSTMLAKINAYNDSRCNGEGTCAESVNTSDCDQAKLH